MPSTISKDAKIYIAGHRGLVGSAILRYLNTEGYSNLLTRTSEELDLTEQQKVRELFQKEKPEYLFLCAAKVGGIHANATYPAWFIHQNLMIQTNLIHEAMLHGVKRLLFLGSSCIYPRACPQPIKEEYLLTGPLESTNRPYAVAKIAGIETCWAYNRQYGTKYLSIMPTNLYGPGDHYDLNTSHVLPAIMRKMHEAKINKRSSVPLWGTGKALREFLYVDELAEAAALLMGLPDKIYEPLIKGEEYPPLINVGSGKDQTISELAHMIAEAVGYEGKIDWDTSKPDGTPRKLLDISRLRGLGWEPKITLQEGIAKTYRDHFLKLM